MIMFIFTYLIFIHTSLFIFLIQTRFVRRIGYLYTIFYLNVTLPWSLSTEKSRTFCHDLTTYLPPLILDPSLCIRFGPLSSVHLLL